VKFLHIKFLVLNFYIEEQKEDKSKGLEFQGCFTIQHSGLSIFYV